MKAGGRRGEGGGSAQWGRARGTAAAAVAGICQTVGLYGPVYGKVRTPYALRSLSSVVYGSVDLRLYCTVDLCTIEQVNCQTVEQRRVKP